MGEDSVNIGEIISLIKKLSKIQDYVYFIRY